MWKTHHLLCSGCFVGFCFIFMLPMILKNIEDSVINSVSHKFKSIIKEKEENDDEQEDILVEYPVDEGPVFVVLLARQRTGSTHLGELLSLAPHSSHIFEPLFMTDDLNKDRSMKSHTSTLEALFRCNSLILLRLLDVSQKFKTLRKLDDYIVKQGRDVYRTLTPEVLSAKCWNSHAVIIKTIRLQMFELVTMLPQFPQVRIIHLVRDPRAMLWSMRGSTIVPWKKANFTEMCSKILMDVIIGDTLPSSLYKRVRYEDLLENKFQHLQGLYSMFNATLSNERFNRYLREHTSSQSKEQHFFQTSRIKDFDGNHWRKEAPPNFTQQVEKECAQLMMKLQYEFIYPDFRPNPILHEYIPNTT